MKTIEQYYDEILKVRLPEGKVVYKTLIIQFLHMLLHEKTTICLGSPKLNSINTYSIQIQI